jgi:hypothetical protein
VVRPDRRDGRWLSLSSFHTVHLYRTASRPSSTLSNGRLVAECRLACTAPSCLARLVVLLGYGRTCLLAHSASSLGYGFFAVLARSGNHGFYTALI